MRYEDAVAAFAAQDAVDSAASRSRIADVPVPAAEQLPEAGEAIIARRMSIRGDMGGVCLISSRPFLMEESDGRWLVWGHRHMKKEGAPLPFCKRASADGCKRQAMP